MYFPAALVLLVSAVGQAWTPPRYEEMDYGPFLSATFQSNGSTDQVTHKGIAVRLEYPRESGAFDEGPIGGGLFSSRPSTDITGTDEQEVYKTQRWKFGGYQLNVPPGSYTLTLKFADSWSNKEQRVFDVQLQGKKVVEKLDIVGRVGKGAALDLKFEDVKVAPKEQLLIQFERHAGEPSISGIVIEGNGYSRKINCGGGATQQYNADWKPAQSVGTGHLGGVIFDTELMRYSTAWTGGYLHLKGVAFDGAHGVNPGPAGNQIMATAPGPGWSHGGSFKDPRAIPHGPLPRNWAHYQGTYRHENGAVFSYTVGDCQVLDMPGAEHLDGVRTITRTLHLGPHKEPLSCLVEEWADADTTIVEGNHSATLVKDGRARLTTLIGKVTGASLAIVESERTVLDLAPHDKPRLLKLVMANGSVDEATSLMSKLRTAEPARELGSLTKGSAARWKQPVTGKSKRAADDGAYASDSIGLPDENPWNAWIRPTALDFFSDGRLAISTLSGDVWIASGIDDELKTVSWRRYATGLFQPLGLRIVKDQVYVLGRDQMTRLHDANADGEADFYENFNNDCYVTANFHEFATDLQTDADGNFYYLKSGPLRPGGRGWDKITPHHGALLKVSKDGSRLEIVATGLRSPNGMTIGPRGEITTSDNEGAWTPTTPINLIRPGGFYGVPELAGTAEQTAAREPPLCWIPHSVDNSGAGQVWIPPGAFGPLGGTLLHLSYGQCQLISVLPQQVGSTTQATAVPLPLKFETGIMRPRFHNKDGALYLTGLRGWQSTATREAALYRVRYTGKPICLPVAVSIREREVAIQFSEPLSKSAAEDLDSFGMQAWNYRWTEQYGSKHYRPSAPDEEGEDELEIGSASLSPDGKTLVLAMPGLKRVMQMRISIDVLAADESPVRFDLYSTVHAIPSSVMPTAANIPPAL